MSVIWDWEFNWLRSSTAQDHFIRLAWYARRVEELWPWERWLGLRGWPKRLDQLYAAVLDCRRVMRTLDQWGANWSILNDFSSRCLDLAGIREKNSAQA